MGCTVRLVSGGLTTSTLSSPASKDVAAEARAPAMVESSIVPISVVESTAIVR